MARGEPHGGRLALHCCSSSNGLLVCHWERRLPSPSCSPLALALDVAPAGLALVGLAEEGGGVLPAAAGAAAAAAGSAVGLPTMRSTALRRGPDAGGLVAVTCAATWEPARRHGSTHPGGTSLASHSEHRIVRNGEINSSQRLSRRSSTPSIRPSTGQPHLSCHLPEQKEQRGPTAASPGGSRAA